MKAEIIIWKDAHSVDEWTELKELSLSPRRIVSVGVVVMESSEMVAVSAGYNPTDGDACTTLMIPLGMIVTRETLIEDVTLL